ncbi:MAG: cbb3-type cytochrome oxidase assembly protein CcoS [Flavobacteriaceae bacterium]|nr:cbb3-type cytochrome oxidase assembly protein CcoS [Flavobacteriaceae bacterium]
MIVIYLMIAVSIAVAVLFLVIFIKLVKSGQYDDVYTPSVRILFDDELIKDAPTLKQDNRKAVSITKKIN